MKALAIDTSNLVMGVAVISDDKIVGEYTTNLKKNHSIRLMPAIQELLEEVEIAPQELDRIIVAKGPGSYTGVRIGVTVAKTLAWTLNKELVGVSSLEVLAQSGRYFNGYVVPIFDARRTQVFTGVYKSDGQFSLLQEDEQIILIKDLLDKLKSVSEPILFLGNDLALHKETIEQELRSQAKFAMVTENNPRPSELALLGVQKEPVENVHAFVPSYLQLAEAEAKWIASQKK
jgi:tRNA threonylcarbamoyladenosine biosynthesis protein TsaB